MQPSLSDHQRTIMGKRRLASCDGRRSWRATSGMAHRALQFVWCQQIDLRNRDVSP
jgi:hypothetical protein